VNHSFNGFERFNLKLTFVRVFGSTTNGTTARMVTFSGERINDVEIHTFVVDLRCIVSYNIRVIRRGHSQLEIHLHRSLGEIERTRNQTVCNRVESTTQCYVSISRISRDGRD
jgi:hypothetical protein